MENDKPSFGQRLKKLFFKIIIGLLILFGLTIWICSWTYSEGTRAGQLIKISKKGVFFKTNEGELNLGGLRIGDQQTALEGNIWSFSVIKKDVLEKVKQYEGKRVKLKYKQRFKSMVWQAKTDYIVFDVEPID